MGRKENGRMRKDVVYWGLTPHSTHPRLPPYTQGGDAWAQSTPMPAPIHPQPGKGTDIGNGIKRELDQDLQAPRNQGP